MLAWLALQVCVETMMHLTCTNMQVEKLESALTEVCMMRRPYCCQIVAAIWPRGRGAWYASPLQRRALLCSHLPFETPGRCGKLAFRTFWLFEGTLLRGRKSSSR